MDSLPRLIRTAMDDQGLVYREVQRRAEELGHQVSHSVIYGYATGKTKRYQDDKLIGIADALGIPRERLLEAAGHPLRGEPFVLPDGADLLEPHERDAVRGVVNAFITNKRKAVTHDDSETPIDELAERRDHDEPQIPTPDQFRKMAAYQVRPEDDERHQREAEWAELGEENQDPGEGE